MSIPCNLLWHFSFCAGFIFGSAHMVDDVYVEIYKLGSIMHTFQRFIVIVLNITKNCINDNDKALTNGKTFYNSTIVILCQLLKGISGTCALAISK